MTTAVTKKEDRETLEAILARPAYAQRFQQVLGDKASQFCSSLVSIGRAMPDVEPKSIIGSAMIAACLDLPIEKNLGFAWIVPYKKDGKKFAQFQMGFKGYIQLALRTGYYAGMNAVPINKEAYKGRDPLGEPIIDWDKLDETAEAIGYAFGFKMVNGFMKMCYWTKDKVKAHAQRYSQSFRGGYDSPWKTHFDKMALKTVIANELSDWGILSVQFQLARKSDQAMIKDIDAEAEYIDGIDNAGQIGNGEEENQHKPAATAHQQAIQGATTSKEPEKKPGDVPKPEKTTEKAQEEDNVSFDDAKPAGNIVNLPQDKPAEQGVTQTPPAGQTTQAPQEAAQGDGKTEAATPAQTPTPSDDPKWGFQDQDSDAVKSIKTVCRNAGLSFNQLWTYLKSKKLARDNQSDLRELASTKLEAINRHVFSWVPDIAKEAK